MEIDFPVVPCISEGIYDTEMPFEQFHNQIKDFNLPKISSGFDSLYQNYCSYILFETIRLFPLFKFEFPLDLTKIFINYYTRPSLTQNILRDKQEVLPMKRKSKEAYRPIKKMKLFEESHSFIDISQYNYCYFLSPLEFIRHQGYLSWNESQNTLIVF